MSVVYSNEHSITFIRNARGTTVYSYKRSWYDFHLIPAKRPSVVTPPPNIRLINIPGSNKRLDLTDSMPGGLTFGRRKGQWEFYVDTTKWGSFLNAKNTIEDYLNGQYVYVVLEDDHSHYYIGRVSTTSWSVDDDYPTVTIDYDLYYTVNTNNFVYSLVPTLLRIESELISNAPTFILGDPLKTVRPWIKTTAYYDNDETDLVEVDSFGNNLIELFPSATVPTKYGNKTSSVTITVMEGTAVGLDGVLKSGKNNQVWLGSDKSILTGIYNFYKKYENGYVAKNYPVTIETPTGQFTELGDQSVEIQNDSLSGEVETFVKVVQTFTPSLSNSNVPAYMRVGEYKDRLTYFLKATGITNGGYLENYTYSDLSINSLDKFTVVGTEAVNVSASNKGVGNYQETVTGSITIPTREAFDIIEDSWEEIDAAIADGSYKAKYKVGDLARLSISGEYNGYVQIIGIDKDYDEDNDTIPITWMLKDALSDLRTFNNSELCGSYLDSEVKSYIEGQEEHIIDDISSMIVSANKEICYYDNGRKYTTALLRLWMLSSYEVLYRYTYHSNNNRSIKYSDYFSQSNYDVERIKFINLNNVDLRIHNNIPDFWLLRDCPDDPSSIGPLPMIPRTGSNYGAGDFSSNKGVVFGFCTGASRYDENIDWVLRKFKALVRTLDIYLWDDYGLASNSDNNTTYDAVEAEIDTHVGLNPASTNITPAVYVGLQSETTTTYTYTVNLVDETSDSDFITAFKTKFNMTSGPIRRSGNVYIVACTMTTNKLTTE